MRTIYIFIQAFLQICLFKHKPQDLPASTTLLIMMLAIYMLMSAILAPASLSMGRSLLWSLVETVLLTGSVASLLYMTKRPERVTQTLTALAGTDSLLSLLSVPFVIWIDQGQNYNFDQTLPTIFMLILMLWSLIIHIHILRHALSVSTFTALVITFILLSLIGTVLLSLFPEIKL